MFVPAQPQRQYGAAQPAPVILSQGGGTPPNVPAQQPNLVYRFGEQVLYSTHAFGNAGTTYSLGGSSARLFVTAQGGTGQGFAAALSVAETNLKESGRVPSGQAFDVYGVNCQVYAWNPSTDLCTLPITDAGANSGLAAFLQNSVATWDFTQTEIYIAPLVLIGAGGGIFGAVADSAGNQIGALNNGNGGIWGYRRNMIALPGNTTFALKIYFSTRAGTLAAGVGLAARVGLLSYYKNVTETA